MPERTPRMPLTCKSDVRSAWTAPAVLNCETLPCLAMAHCMIVAVARSAVRVVLLPHPITLIADRPDTSSNSESASIATMRMSFGA